MKYRTSPPPAYTPAPAVPATRPPSPPEEGQPESSNAGLICGIIAVVLAAINLMLTSAPGDPQSTVYAVNFFIKVFTVLLCGALFSVWGIFAAVYRCPIEVNERIYMEEGRRRGREPSRRYRRTCRCADRPSGRSLKS